MFSRGEDTSPFAHGHIMPLGDHLEELRKRLIWGLLGVVPPMLLGLAYWRTIMAFLMAPANDAIMAKGLPPVFQVTTFFEMFNSALKLSIVLSIILAAPWLLYQVWLFIAPGLYKHERRYAYIVAPLSLVLTVSSALFLYYVMLPVVLAFFVTFNGSLELPPAKKAPLPAGVTLASIPVLDADPIDPPPGAMWINRPMHQIRVAVPKASAESVPTRVGSPADTGPEAGAIQRPPEGTAAAESTPIPTTLIRGVWLVGGEMVAQQYRVADYVSMLFGFGLAFAAGFQMPIVVLLLGWAGLVNPRLLAKYRRHAMMACAVLGAVLTPADPISMVVLAVPLYGLFELGSVLLRVFPAVSKTDEDEANAAVPRTGGESQDEPPDA